MTLAGSGTRYEVFIQNQEMYKRYTRTTYKEDGYDKILDDFNNQVHNSTKELQNLKDEEVIIHYLPGGSLNTTYNPADMIGMYSSQYEYEMEVENGMGEMKILKQHSIDIYNKVEAQQVKDKIEELYKGNLKVLNSVGFIDKILQDSDGKFEVSIDGTKKKKKDDDEENFSFLQQLLKRDRIDNNQLEIKDVVNMENKDTVMTKTPQEYFGYDKNDYMNGETVESIMKKSKKSEAQINKEMKKELDNIQKEITTENMIDDDTKDVVDDMKDSIKKAKEIEKKSNLLSSVMNNKKGDDV